MKIVILEGFLYSTLVISSNTNGGKLLIEDKKNGLLFENENIEDLADKIFWLLQNHHSYNKITKEAFFRLENEFSLTALQNNLQKILLKIQQQ